MWFLIVFVVVAVFFAALLIARARRRRQRDRDMILGEMRALVRILDEPTADPPIRFTRPFRSDEDRANDTMFSASHGSTRLSFILDTSRMRVRWWVLCEWFAPEDAGSTRTLRVETDFIGRDIPTALIQALLKSARGEAVERAPEPSEPPTENRVDPFEPPASDEALAEERDSGPREIDKLRQFLSERDGTGSDRLLLDKPPHD